METWAVRRELHRSAAVPPITDRQFEGFTVPEFSSPAELKTALQDAPGGRRRLMGLDVGSKTIGLALADATLTVATPLETIKRRKFTLDVEHLAALCEEHGIGGLVIGLPVNMDGSEGPRVQSMRQFARNVDEKLSLAYCFWDERLSTAAVERMLVDEADMTRRRRGEVVDKLAAAYILQGALDAMAAD